MSNTARFVLVLWLLACTTAQAQTPDARRRIYPTQDGFLEVDPRTGAITECKRSSGGYQCSRVTEGDPLLKEEPPAVARQPPNPAPPPIGPTDEELDRALNVMERFLRRFLDVVREHRGERT